MVEYEEEGLNAETGVRTCVPKMCPWVDEDLQEGEQGEEALEKRTVVQRRSGTNNQDSGLLEKFRCRDRLVMK